jgi:hypothetical protein
VQATLEPTFTPDRVEFQTAWPIRLQPLLDVLIELGYELRAVKTRQLISDAPSGMLTLCTIVGPSTADLSLFIKEFTSAIHRRPKDNNLWRDLCGVLRICKTPQGLVVVFESAIGKEPTLH